jgi:hypothetical protein
MHLMGVVSLKFVGVLLAVALYRLLVHGETISSVLWTRWEQIALVVTFILNLVMYALIAHQLAQKSNTRWHSARKAVAILCVLVSLGFLFVAFSVTFSNDAREWWAERLTFSSFRVLDWHYGFITCAAFSFLVADIFLALDKNELWRTVALIDAPLLISFTVLFIYYIYKQSTIPDPDPELHAFMAGAVGFQMIFASIAFDPKPFFKNEGSQKA